MFSRFLAISFFLATPACVGAETTDVQIAEVVVQTAKDHFAIHENVRSSGSALAPSHSGLTEVQYNLPSGERFATYYVNSDGALSELVINGPTSEQYVKTPSRRFFLERLIGLMAPQSTSKERVWAAGQLDGVWTERVRPLPVQVGNYVFDGGVVRSPKGAHDNFKIIAVGTGATGLKFQSTP
ncbi:hypothetical protein [Qipengyuania qiaonensis]|uniref:Uncharacterized protein n=1 Tax=Qipengyuania qiaonensis TaxID=2867240 RepID=A0ABS7JAN9_9SPHN|nr:hypothetical protein [Qipengyuania qiaonensis]MBX7483015.1 hypothetical protein [Qipengyuania qiaonensis]